MTCQFESLGETWVNLVSLTVKHGDRLSDEGYELRNLVVSYLTRVDGDPIIERFGDAQMIAQMRSVFFNEGSNCLGHSYAKLMRGPAGRNDLTDIVELLRAEPWSKRATLTLCGTGNGKVPCINVVQFLVRNETVEASYFARGQDAYRKFYADGLCLAAMVRNVAVQLKLAPGQITGLLASSHVYHIDIPAIERMLAAAGNAAARLNRTQ